MVVVAGAMVVVLVAGLYVVLGCTVVTGFEVLTTVGWMVVIGLEVLTTLGATVEVVYPPLVLTTVPVVVVRPGPVHPCGNGLRQVGQDGGAWITWVTG